MKRRIIGSSILLAMLAGSLCLSGCVGYGMALLRNARQDLNWEPLPRGESLGETDYYTDDYRSREWRQIVSESAFRLGEEQLASDLPEDASDASGEQRILEGHSFSAHDVEYIRTFGTYPLLDGSTVCKPMIEEFARQHLSSQLSDKELREFIGWFGKPNTTPIAFKSLVLKKDFENHPKGDEHSWQVWSIGEPYHAHCIMQPPVGLYLGTRPSEAQISWAKTEGVALYMQPICHDAFIFITHEDNPVDSLTMDEIRRIYTGEITNWSEVGGEDLRIFAFQRNEGSGSQTAMDEMVMQGRAMLPALTHRAETMDPVVEGQYYYFTADYINNAASIGYTYLFYIQNMYPSAPVKVLAIDGIQPTVEAIRSGAYPLSVPYYGVIRQEDRDDVAGRFLDWILTEEGQACVEQAGYIRLAG